MAYSVASWPLNIIIKISMYFVLIFEAVFISLTTITSNFVYLHCFHFVPLIMETMLINI